MSREHRFHYHASGHAFSGELTRPAQHIIPVQAATSLPTTGGVGASHVENFRLAEVVSFARGSAHVSGSIKVDRQGVIHTTHATATIESLNILDIVTADRIVAHLSSSYRVGAPAREPEVLVIGSKFENLCFAGYQMDVELHHQLFLGLKTHQAIKTAWDTQAGNPPSEFRTLADETADAIPEGKPPSLDRHEGVLCTVVKEVHFRHPGFGNRQGAFMPPGVTQPRHGRHVFHIVDFGDIFLAEVLCQHGRKTLTMLRIELGSPNGGGFIAAEVTSNGWPPWG